MFQLRNLALSTVSTLVVLSGLVSGGSTTLAAQPSAGSGAVQTAEESLRADAASYVRMFGGTTEEAMRRLHVQEGAGELVSTLRQTYAGRLAGIYFDNGSNFRLVVRLKGTDPVAATSNTVSGGTIKTDFVVGAPSTQAELLAAIDANLGAIQSLLPTLQGAAASDRTGEIVLDVYATGAAASSALAQDAAVEAPSTR